MLSPNTSSSRRSAITNWRIYESALLKPIPFGSHALLPVREPGPCIFPRVLEIAEEIGGLKNELKHLKKSEKTAQDALKESKEQFEKWKLEFPCRTKQQLMQHGTDVIAPAAAYYNNLFHSPDGRHYNMRIMAEAAKIFNPIILSECSDGDGKSLRLKAKRDVDVNSHIVQLTRTCQDLLTS
jgi:hypothetical protein